MGSKRIGLFTLGIAAALALAACTSDSSSSSGSSSSSDSSSQGGHPAVAAPGKYGQVTVSGAVNVTSGFLSAQWGDMPGDLRADLKFGLCGVTINVPHGSQPGTYPIGDDVTNNGSKASASYTDSCNSAGIYPSMSGTLTLTSLNPTWSGSFDFTGRDSNDASKTVHVTGSFHDVSKV